MNLGSRILLCSVLFASSNLFAHAETITTFSLTHAGQLFQFSIDSTTPVSYFNDGTSNDEESFTWSQPLTVNGQLTSTIHEGVENLYKLGTGAQFFLEYISATVDGVPHHADIFEQGNPIYSKVNGYPVFTAGTFYFPQVVDYDYYGPSSAPTVTSTLSYPDDKLVVTKTDSVASPVPEPSTLALLGSGLLGGLQLVRRRASISVS